MHGSIIICSVIKCGQNYLPTCLILWHHDRPCRQAKEDSERRERQERQNKLEASKLKKKGDETKKKVHSYSDSAPSSCVGHTINPTRLLKFIETYAYVVVA